MRHVHRDMEAEGDGYPTIKVTKWNGDWESDKQKFEAAAELSGLAAATRVGQLVADGKIAWPHNEEETYEPKTEWDQDIHRAKMKSTRLASILILSLIDTVGVQNSIVTDRLRHQKDGVRAWADLIVHFEKTSEDLRIESLIQKWDAAQLTPGQHPDQLWSKLAAINQNLNKFGEERNEKNFIRRYIGAIKDQEGHPYKEVFAMYRGSIIAGKPYTAEQLRELFSETYADNNLMKNQESAVIMKGFMTTVTCSHCLKQGHTAEQCWKKHPSKAPRRNTAGPRREGKNANKEIECWKCGRRGHKKNECRSNFKNTVGISATVKENTKQRKSQHHV